MSMPVIETSWNGYLLPNSMGVKIAILIDAIEAGDLDGITQINLGIRNLHNSPEVSPNQMAA